MRRGAVVVLMALLVVACGGDDAASDAKLIRQGARASATGDTIWVVGGAQGTLAEMQNGALHPIPDAVAYDVDGEEARRIDVSFGGGDAPVNTAVVDVDGRLLLVGGRCQNLGFGCGGPTRPLVAWLDDDGPTEVDLGGVVEGEAVLVGVAGGAAWAVVGLLEQQLARIEVGAAEATLLELPPFAFTGDSCAGPDGLVAAVSHLDDEFQRIAAEVYVRDTAVDSTWTSVGVVPFPDRHPPAFEVFCPGGGEVVLDTGDGNGGPMLLSLDDARPLDVPPLDGLRGDLTGFVDAVSGTLVIGPASPAGPGSVWARDPGGEWREVGVVSGAAPSLAIVSGEVVNLAGMASVVGAVPVGVGALP